MLRYRIILLLLIPSMIMANNFKTIDSLKTKLLDIKETTEEAKLYKTIASLYRSEEKNLEALENYKHAEERYTTLGDSVNWALCLNEVASIYLDISNFEKSLDLLYKAQEINNNKNLEVSYQIQINLANLYEQIDNFNDALGTLNDLTDIIDKLEEPDKKLVNIYSSIGIVYGRQNILDSALIYFRKTLKLLKNEEQLGGIYNNIGAIHYKLANDDSAKYYYLKAYDVFASINHKRGIGISKLNLGQIEIDDHNFLAAHKLIDSSVVLLKDLKSFYHLRRAYLLLSDLYKAENDFRSSLEYFEKYTQVNDSIMNNEMISRLSSIQLEDDIALMETEIKALKMENELRSSRNIILIFSFILWGVIGLLIILWQRIKLKNSKLAEEISLKEQELLKQDLKYRERELESFAFNLVHKNEILNDVKGSLKKLVRNSSEENKGTLQDFGFKINQALKNSSELEQLNKRINEVNQAFFSKLSSNYPDLTDNEKKLCALLRIDLSSKEIATLNNVSERAIVVARHRLRKKLDINSDEGLPEFLNKMN